MRAASLDLGRMVVDRDQEMAESARLRAKALAAAQKADRVRERVDRVNRLYRERLTGNREPRDQEDKA